MNLNVVIVIVAQIGHVSADNIGWNRLLNSVNQLKRSNTNQADDYNGQMLRHLIKQDEQTFQKFLKFLRSQNSLSANGSGDGIVDSKTYVNKYHKINN